MGDLPAVVEDWEKLRGDQKYLYRMVRAINDGVCDEKLAGYKPGPVSTARWLTTASRILRLYISKKDPSQALRKLVEFIVNSYSSTLLGFAIGRTTYKKSFRHLLKITHIFSTRIIFCYR